MVPKGTTGRRLRQPLIALLASLVALLALAGTGSLAPRTASAAVTFDAELFTLINQDRAQNGLPALTWNSSLGNVAETAPYGGCGYTIAGRAEDMVNRNYFSHTLLSCGTQNVFNILQADGIPYSWAGENIAWASGITDPVQAAEYENQMYMNSPEHRANILNANYTAVGVGSWQTASGQSYQGATNVWVSVEDFTNTPTAPNPGPVCPTANKLTTTSTWTTICATKTAPSGTSSSAKPAKVEAPSRAAATAAAPAPAPAPRHASAAPAAQAPASPTPAPAPPPWILRLKPF